MTNVTPLQSYPPPTELPAMRAGEKSGRYMDCSLVLNPIDDRFTTIVDITVTVSRWDGQPLGSNDLQRDTFFENSLDVTGTIATFGWIAPAANPGATYLLSLSTTTAEGETFVRDFSMSVLPVMG